MNFAGNRPQDSTQIGTLPGMRDENDVGVNEAELHSPSSRPSPPRRRRILCRISVRGTPRLLARFEMSGRERRLK
jgi:hypothetical protein